MKKSILTLLALLPLLSFGQRGYYKAILSKVEVQGKITADSLAIKLDSLTNPKNNHFVYADNNIEINWYNSTSQFNFEIRNKLNETIKIIWDDASYIDTDGSSKKVFHAGVKYIDRNNAQPPTTIIKDSKLSDLITPTENVYFSSGSYGGWRELPLFDYSRKDVVHKYNNKHARILLPISIGGNVQEYIFTFTVNWIEEIKEVKKKKG
ncbi:hypothetical protein [Pedobacter borealis]|uniref:hypothetical protein n=1 Tax=Pedobacter borealis TaxID=475254 RepID=UPI0004936E3B|nr:hypothetical protein [Pedobacter borealis]